MFLQFQARCQLELQRPLLKNLETKQHYKGRLWRPRDQSPLCPIPMFQPLLCLISTSAQLAISNQGLETTICRPLVIRWAQLENHNLQHHGLKLHAKGNYPGTRCKKMFFCKETIDFTFSSGVGVQRAPNSDTNSKSTNVSARGILNMTVYIIEDDITTYCLQKRQEL